jgi:subtilase family serine protease
MHIGLTQRSRFRAAPLVVALALLLSALPVFALAPAQAATAQVSLSGTVTPALKGARRLGPTNPNQRLDLAITLPTQHAAQLTALIGALYNPRSPAYGHWLSAAQFAARFGLNSAQVGQVQQYLRSQGLTVGRQQGPFVLDASGTVAQAKAAFGVQINNYVGANGQRFYAAASEVRIPSSLAGLISGVIGLDNAEHWHPELVRASKNAPHYGGGPGFFGGGLTPSQVRGIYDANPLINSGITGTGQTTGVFELSTYSISDIKQYVTYYNLKPVGKLINVNVGTPGSGGADEVELDVDLQVALASKVADFYLYNAPNTNSGVVNEYARIASDNLAKSVSTSWGICEQQNPPQVAQAENQSFQQMATQGQSIYAAAGDSGAYDCGGSTLAVDDPASQPYMTGVGGTHFTGDPGKNPNPSYIPETVWNDGSSGGAGGGGLSTVWSLQSWETGPGVQNQYSNGMREVPDVALDADENTGYSIYYQGFWQEFGGTSCAAPLWAAFTDLLNQLRAQNKHGTFGFAAPSIYSLASGSGYSTDFHDITQGNNLHYPATPNYDLASGWGSYDVNNLANAFK